MPEASATLHIGDVTERVGLSLRSVRYYEEQGLLVPEGRTDGGFRLFGEAQVQRLLLIKQMKPLGFSLDEMRELIDARDVAAEPAAPAPERAAAQARLAGFADRADERCAKLRAAVEAGEALAGSLRREAATSTPD